MSSGSSGGSALKWLAIIVFVAVAWQKGWFPGIVKALKGPWFAFSAPAIVGGDLMSGSKVTLADFKGKVVLVNFWVSADDTSRDALTTLTRLDSTYKGKGFTVLGVVMDNATSVSVQRFGLFYPNVLGDADLLASYIGNQPTLPCSALVDRKGRLLTTYRGSRTYQEFETDIKKAL